MKVGDAIVIFFQKTPDLQGMCVIAVKGPVNKLNLGDLFLKEKTQLSFYPVHTAQPHGPVDGRKAIAAGQPLEDS
jgi:hypothetical protein